MEATSPQAGRPRDPALEQAILAAAVDVFAEQGFARTTVEEVARAARTGKAAIYRRWPSKTALAIAAVRSLQTDIPVPDTGSLRGDLLSWARHYTDGDKRAPILLANLIADAGHDPELRRASYEAIGKPPADALRAVIDHWIGEGVVPRSTPVELILAVIPSMAFRHVAVNRTALDAHTVTEIVDHILLPALQHRPDRTIPC